MSRRSVNHWQKRLIRQHRSSTRNLAKLSRNARQNSNQGFALPMALGMGLIMLLVGVTMILRSQDDQVTASAQKQTAQGLGINEVGVTRFQALLAKFPGLASKTYDPENGFDEWSVCGPSKSSEVTAVINNKWIPVENTGHFKIIKYDPGTNPGTLQVLGTTDTDTTRLQNTGKPQGAVSFLEVEIPRDLKAGTIPPGLWVSSFDAGSNQSIGQTNQQIDGDVFTQDCDFTTSDFDPEKNFPDNTDWTVSPRPFQQFPELPSLPPHITEVTDLCEDYSASLPKSYLVSQVAQAINDLIVPSAFAQPNGNKDKDKDKDGSGGSEKCDVELPDDSDLPDPGTTNTYSYLVSSLEVDQLTITPGKTVRIYVQGDIELRGNSGISAETNALQIYGSNGTGINGPAVNYALSSDANTYITTEIRTRGGSNIYAFIYAPAAIAGVKGGGSSGGFHGSLWVKTWAGPPFGSSSNKIVVDAPSDFDWSALPGDGNLQRSFESIKPITSWKRRRVP